MSDHLGNVRVVLSDRKRLNSSLNILEVEVLAAYDYYPFGMMLQKIEPSNGYRFGFNGKERDPEGMGGGGSTYDYGFRIYNPAVARFLSVDPLTREYPWYTPYQFAGNKPIWKIDLDGLEEADPPGTGAVHAAFDASGGSEEFKKQPSTEELGFNYFIESHDIPGNVPNNKLNTFVNSNTKFEANEGGITPQNFVNILLGNFIAGTGPENYVFPMDGAVSNSMKGSGIVHEALTDFYLNNAEAIVKDQLPKGQSKGVGFDFLDQISQNIQTGSIIPTTVENFVGSGRVTIEVVNKDKIQVTIFNITTLTSGSISKHLPWNDYPKSIVRTGVWDIVPYANISQTFSFTLSIDKDRAADIELQRAKIQIISEGLMGTY